MWGKAKPIPEGYHTLTPYLIVENATRALDFYKQAFGAEIKSVHHTESGKAANASFRIGDSMLLLSDSSFAGSPCQAPQPGVKASVMIHVYVENADETFNRAVSAGAAAIMPMMDAFWGDRYGQVKDPFGHQWSIATHKEDLSAKEIEKRGKSVFVEMGKAHPG